MEILPESPDPFPVCWLCSAVGRRGWFTRLIDGFLCTFQFRRVTIPVNSTHREDYRHYSVDCYHPDVSIRRKGLLMNDVSFIQHA